MAWFKRVKPGISTQNKKELPDGLWVKCDGCEEVIYKKQLAQNSHVCPKCDFHFRINNRDYIKLALDPDSFEEIDTNLESVDFLHFKEKMKYSDKLRETMRKTGMKDAIRTGKGSINGMPVVFGVMDFDFIGGSMGSVVGEKIARATDRAMESRCPLILVCASGGARMMESIISFAYRLFETSRAWAWSLTTKVNSRNFPVSMILLCFWGSASGAWAMNNDLKAMVDSFVIGMFSAWDLKCWSEGQAYFM